MNEEKFHFRESYRELTCHYQSIVENERFVLCISECTHGLDTHSSHVAFSVCILVPKKYNSKILSFREVFEALEWDLLSNLLDKEDYQFMYQNRMEERDSFFRIPVKKGADPRLVWVHLKWLFPNLLNDDVVRERIFGKGDEDETD